MPFGSTQQGIAEALEQSRTAVSFVCTDLELQGLIETAKARVDGLPYRVRCYCLTPKAAPQLKLAEQRLKLIEDQAGLVDLLGSIEVSVTFKGK